MRCLIFGYGYMGKIRERELRKRSDVRSITIVDPQVDPQSAGLGSALLQSASEIQWDDVDVAFICTPNNVTAELCIQALKRCGHVFCEKPPGRSWEEFCQISEVAENLPGHTLVFGFNHRLHPSIQAAKALIGPGGLGELLYLKATYGKSGGARYRESWRTKPEICGGGILLDQGIHMLDIFQVFAGRLAVVDAILTDGFWHCGLEDNAFLLLRSQHGIPGFLHSSATLWKHTFSVEIGCVDGYLIASGLLSQTGSYGREQLVVGKRQFEDETLALGNPREEIIYFDRDESWQREIDAFFTAVKERKPAAHGTLEDARSVMELVREAYAIQRARNGPPFHAGAGLLTPMLKGDAP